MARRARPWYRNERKAWFVTIAGVQHNLGETKKEAFDRFHQLMGKPQRRCVSSQSLAAIIDEFLEFCRLHRSPANFQNYRYRLQQFVDRWPNLRPDELRPFHVEKWADAYEISRTTRRNYLRAVKRCLRWAKQQGYIDENPIADLEVPSGENREVCIRPAEFDQLLTFVRDDAFRQLLVVAFDTGARPQEILKVTSAHVDVVNSRWLFKKSEAKMKRRVRVVYLAEKSLKINKRLMAENPTGPLFRNTRGLAWTTAAVNCHFKRVRIRMGMEEFERRGDGPNAAMITDLLNRLSRTRTEKSQQVTKSDKELLAEARRKIRYREAARLAPQHYSMYALRHSWATNALERGVDALTVAVLMGHSDPSTLARVYQHVSQRPEYMLEQARRATG